MIIIAVAVAIPPLILLAQCTYSKASYSVA